MSTIVDKTKELIEEIKHSKEYQDYQNLQKIIEKDGELFRRVNSYRKRAFLLHNSSHVGNVMQQVRELRAEYQQELNNEDVLQYLIAEQKVCKIIREISGTIAKEIEIDYHFLEDESI